MGMKDLERGESGKVKDGEYSPDLFPHLHIETCFVVLYIPCGCVLLAGPH